MHCTIWPIAPRPCFVAAAGPVRIIPGFLDDVLEDLPPASEQAAVMLVQIGFDLSNFTFWPATVRCQLDPQSSLAQSPMKVCAPVQSNFHSVLQGPLHKLTLQLQSTP